MTLCDLCGQPLEASDEVELRLFETDRVTHLKSKDPAPGRTKFVHVVPCLPDVMVKFDEIFLTTEQVMEKLKSG